VYVVIDRLDPPDNDVAAETAVVQPALLNSVTVEVSERFMETVGVLITPGDDGEIDTYPIVGGELSITMAFCAPKLVELLIAGSVKAASLPARSLIDAPVTDNAAVDR
jgi:hypothetical protein